MELQAITTANYLDILFDNRNKAYGGYQLRKNYNKRTLSAFSIVIGAIILVSGYVALSGNTPTIQTAALPGEITLTEIKPPTIVIPERIAPPPPSGEQPKTVKSTPPVIVPDDTHKPTDQPTEVNKLDNAVPGSSTTDGAAAISGTPSVAGDGNAKPAITPVEPPASTPFTAVQEMPEFNGDISAYLRKQLTYPAAARENGVEGQVVVQFIVNEDGHISGAKIMRGIGGGCNEEAIRVVNSMPKWKPGRQNGKAVKVYYTLPIRFQLD